MRILQINSHAATGGAGRVVYRLHHAFRRLGHFPRIIARSVREPEPEIYSLDQIAPTRLRRLAVFANRRFAIPTLHLSTRRIIASPFLETSDIVHLHNIHGNYFNYHLLPALTAAKPTVWTLHDMWALTGHCTYSYECERWRQGCHHCPLFKPQNQDLLYPPPTLVDRTRRVWRHKRLLYRRSRLTVVTPSRWLQGLAQESILGQGREIHFIPNGVDLGVFKPVEQAHARNRLGIPQPARVVLFVAEKTADRRKGFLELLQALEQLKERDVVLVTMGKPGSHLLPSRFQVIELGFIRDEAMQSLAYAAADLFVFPSLADNQPLVLIESLACGTPIVAFDVGGIPEMVRHMETGYLARYQDTTELAHGIIQLLHRERLRQDMRVHCRRVAVAEYGLQLQVSRYLDLYRILEKDGKK